MRPGQDVPVRLGLLFGISRLSVIYIECEWLENHHSFVKISGGRSMTLFCCRFSRGVLRAQLISGKTVREKRRDGTSFQTWQACKTAKRRRDFVIILCFGSVFLKEPILCVNKESNSYVKAVAVTFHDYDCVHAEKTFLASQVRFGKRKPLCVACGAGR